MSLAQVQGIGQVKEDVSLREGLSAPHGRHREIDDAEHAPQDGQHPASVPAKEVGAGGEQVHPANLAQDSPPVGPQQAALGTAVAEGQPRQNEHTGPPEPFAGLEGGGIAVPYQEKAQYHQQPVHALVARHSRLGVVDEDAHRQEGEAAGQDVPQGISQVTALGKAVFKGIGDRHAHGKEEHGVHDVGQGHAVLPGVKMDHPGRGVQHGPGVVYKHHQGHGEGPEDVDGYISFIHFPVN